ncbi:MAG: polysaccharide deacetylase family protein [Anaerolineae bacterium]|nr:polysaccharide deacetylase family protein [Anaerolineae bacterium]
MSIPGLAYLRLGARWLRSRLTGGALILGYHRVAKVDRDSFSICVSPQHFGEQLEVLSRMARVISLGELVSRLQEKRVPKRAVVLTFDDGYADLLYQASPLLARYGMPATAFVSSGWLGRAFWWDRLERILYAAGRPLEPLALQLRDGRWEWAPGGPRRTRLRARFRARGWEQAVVWSIHGALLPLSPDEREQALARLLARSGVAIEEGPPAERPPTERSLEERPLAEGLARALTADELCELAAGGLIAIGAHTVTHPDLTRLPSAAQRAEIEADKAQLEGIVGRPVTQFAYPHDRSSQETRALVRQAGFDCACASGGVIQPESDPFALPRFRPGDWNGERLARWLQKWLPA